MVKNTTGVTGFEAGLSGDAQVRIALQKIDSNGGVAQTPLKSIQQLKVILVEKSFPNKARLVYGDL
jgi:hypothetical protein